MTFLLANWRLVLAGLLIAWGSLATWAWNHEVHAFADYKAQVEAEGRTAQGVQDALKKSHDAATKEVTDALAQSLPAIQANAVDAYRRHVADRLRQQPGGGQVRPTTDDAQGPDAGGCKQVAIDDETLIGCAHDAAIAEGCAAWGRAEGFPVGE